MAEPSTTHRARGLRAHDGDIAAVVARRVLLFVALVVLFVDHYQAEILYRCKDARPRSNHHGSYAGPDSAPLLGALGIVKCGMQNSNAVAEAVKELTGHRGRQSDLRHQQQRAASQHDAGVDRL